MRTPSPSWCGLELTHLWPTGSSLGDPIDYGPVLLLMPFRFHLTMDTLPSEEIIVGGFRSALACFRLSLSCPFRLLHTFLLLRPARHYSRVRIWRSSFERQRDFNPPEQRAAQRASGRRWRTQLPGCWPPSAAQTVQAVFPHTAFTKTHAFEAQWLGSTESGSPARTRHTTWF